MRRGLGTSAEVDAHLEWLRYAVRDRHVDVRLILEGLLEVVDMLAGHGPPDDRPPR